MAFDVENLMPNSIDASRIVDYRDKTFLMNAILISGGIEAYFFTVVDKIVFFYMILFWFRSGHYQRSQSVRHLFCLAEGGTTS